jgi:DNA-binding IclR family transcriptional regulator
MDRSRADRRRVTTVETALDVVEHLWRSERATLGELAGELDMAKSTVHRHLVTLRHRGYVVRGDDETYKLSLRFLDIGRRTQTSERAYVLAESKVTQLAEQTDERAQFIVEENGRAVYVHMASGDRAVITDTHIGKHTNIHASAGGLAILAHVDRERVEEILERRGLARMTQHTITDPEDLFDELDAIRDRGYSINDQGHIEGLRAIGVPVEGPTGEVVGALSVSGPTNRLSGERLTETLPQLLLGAANELELNIAYR